MNIHIKVSRKESLTAHFLLEKKAAVGYII